MNETSAIPGDERIAALKTAAGLDGRPRFAEDMPYLTAMYALASIAAGRAPKDAALDARATALGDLIEGLHARLLAEVEQLRAAWRGLHEKAKSRNQGKAPDELHLAYEFEMTRLRLVGDEARAALARAEQTTAEAQQEITACRSEFQIVAETRSKLLALAAQIVPGMAAEDVAKEIKLLLVRPIYTFCPWHLDDLAEALAADVQAAPDDAAPMPGDGREPELIPPMAYLDHNGSIWVAAGGGDAGPRKLYLPGSCCGVGIPIEQADLSTMTTMFPADELALASALGAGVDIDGLATEAIASVADDGDTDDHADATAHDSGEANA